MSGISDKTPAELIEMYIAIRDRKKELDDAHKEKCAKINEGLEKLEGILLAKLQDLGVDSLTAKGVGTVYRNKQDSASVQDKSAFKQWLDETGNWDAADIKANKTAVREYLAGGVVVPGVAFNTTLTVGVRRG